MRETILKTKNLTKIFKNDICVDNLSINVRKGDIYGFLGKNGAGKTTTLKMILGLIPSTKGEIFLFNKNIKKNNYSHLSKIGSIIEFPSFYENLTAYENLKIHQQYLGIYDKRLIDEALDKLSILKVKNKKVKEFSLGMKQRLGIARSILHKPEILILDEPTNGLDPMGIREIREFIKQISLVDKTTVIISSHILSEIQLLATQIGVIDNGKLLKEISKEDLKKQASCYIKIKVNDIKKAVQVLKHTFKLEKINTENDYIFIDSQNNNLKNNEISKILINSDLELFEITTIEENLENYFLKLTGGKKFE